MCSRESATNRTRTVTARVRSERFPARSTARNLISYVPGWTVTTVDATEPDELAVDLAELALHALATVDEHHRPFARSSIR